MSHRYIMKVACVQQSRKWVLVHVQVQGVKSAMFRNSENSCDTLTRGTFAQVNNNIHVVCHCLVLAIHALLKRMLVAQPNSELQMVSFCRAFASASVVNERIKHIC